MLDHGPTAPGKMVGDYIIHQQIGSGSFADVWKAQHVDSGKVVAIKEIATGRLNRKLKQSLESEVSILQRISHFNVVKLHSVFEIEEKLYLVMEYCAGGDLAGFIKRRRRISEEEARPLMQQLAAGLRELWCRHLVHRDLKPQNLLLSSTAPDAALKIADFGFARDLHPQNLAETLCGSPLYMAPEILKGCKYDSKADLWSIGTILYELLVGRPPFTGANHLQLLHNIERTEPKIPAVVLAKLSPDATGLIHSLLKRNPLERVAFEEFFSHPFLVPEAASRSCAPASPTASTTTTAHPAFASSPGVTSAHGGGQGAQQPRTGAGGGLIHGPWDTRAGPAEALPFFLEQGAKGIDGRSHHGQLVGIELPAARFVAPPAVLVPSAEGASGRGDLRSSGSSMRSAQMAGPSLGDSAAVREDDDLQDYVFVDPVSSPASSSQASRSSSFLRSGSATPVYNRHHNSKAGALYQQIHPGPAHHLAQPPPRPHEHPSASRAAAGGGSAQGMTFILGVSRVEGLRRVARLLDSELPYLPACSDPTSAPGSALVLRILALQVLGSALDLVGRDAASAGQHPSGRSLADVITEDMRSICARADEAAAAVASAGGQPANLPDVWELIFQAALSLARAAAVDELLGATLACLRAYSRAASLFYFMFAEAPSLPLQPSLVLSPADVHRLQKYTTMIAMRYNAAAASPSAAAAAAAAASPVAAGSTAHRAHVPTSAMSL